MRFHRAQNNPAVLLLVTGSLIGLYFPLGKIAAAARISPLLWATVLSFGAAAFLLPILLAGRRFTIPSRHLIRYAVISGLVTFVIANLLVFTVIPHVGSGFTGLMFALSPVFTLAIASLFRFRAPGMLGLAGIAAGLAGAAVVTLTRQASTEVTQPIWLIVALLIPFSLACGNVYRTIDWPDGISPDLLAFWSHAFSALVLIGLMFVTYGGVPIADLARAPVAALLQALVGGLTFPVFFRLQQVGGPVMLSQLGYVAAAVGLIAATVFLGETYSALTWAGSGVVAIGIAMTILAQRR